MKKTFLIGILTIMLVLPSFSQKNKPKRQVLFTLERNEIIFEEEFAFQLNTKGSNFCCVVQDQSTYNTSIIWNGKRVAYDALLEYLDMKDFNNSVYTYNTKNGKYIHCKRKNYGPYTYVEPCMFNSEPKTSGRFKFSYDNKVIYIHDYDGEIYKLNEGRWTYSSPNKKHTLLIDKNYKHVTLDGIKYTLPLDKNFVEYGTKRDWPQNIFVLDNGICMIEIYGHISGKWKDYCFRINKGTIKELNPHEIIDMETGDITQYGQEPFKEYPDVIHDRWGVFDNPNFIFNDPTDSHMFYSNWDYDYVLIDGEKYGQACPLNAIYDKKRNAFVWYALEGQQLVRYTFRL